MRHRSLSSTTSRSLTASRCGGVAILVVLSLLANHRLLYDEAADNYALPGTSSFVAGSDSSIVSSRPSLRKINETQQQHNNTTEDTATASIFWDSLDLLGEINCGKYKCLFHRKSNEQIAYLVGSNFRGYQFEEEWNMTWKFAQYLRSTFHIKHLYLEAPRRVMVLPTALETFTNRTWMKKSQPMYSGGHFASVQKVRLAPDPWKIVMVTRKGFKSFYDEKVLNKSSFISTFRNDIENALGALEAAPLLAQDYQIIMDGEGNIYQFDLDRVFLGGVFMHSEFQKKLANTYDKSTKLLHKMAAWSYKEQDLDGDNNHLKARYSRNGEAVLADYLRNSTSLSCKAMNTVRGMTGRKGDEEKEKVRAATLAMVLLVQTYDGPEGNEDGMWNCSL
ncbi:hypothetical protein ACHAXR_008912 [Thalassiosira sp. AJA248-18]